jgi:hypothetical protein
MELNEFIILIGESFAQGHGITISGTGMRRSAGEKSSTVATRSQHRVLGTNSMNGSVFHVEGNDPDTLIVWRHEQVQTKVLNKVGGIKR